MRFGLRSGPGAKGKNRLRPDQRERNWRKREHAASSSSRQRMNSATTPIIVALVVQVGLALGVFQANPKRRSNQCFLLLSLAICVWLANLYFGLNTIISSIAEFCIREACATGAIIFALVNLLRLTIRNRESRWRYLLRDASWWFAVSIGIVILCQTDFFLKGVRLNV